MEISQIRAQFPVTRRYAYLNHASVAALPLHWFPGSRPAGAAGSERGLGLCRDVDRNLAAVFWRHGPLETKQTH